MSGLHGGERKIMKERPILFSAPMIRALIDGSKTQTRRLLNPQPVRIIDLDSRRNQKRGDLFIGPDKFPTDEQTRLVFAYAEGPGSTRCLGMQNFCEEFSPYGQPGDRLWCRETFRDCSGETRRKKWEYRADESREDRDMCPVKWKPSIFMPRTASRLTLEITSIGVERLQDITEDDARAEGVRLNSTTHWATEARDAYKTLWEQINGIGSWDRNDFVWVLTFKRI
jgi:hypothetical protein